MDVQAGLDKLNEEQRAAVTAPRGHYLILAGAGSGKTRVLVHRIAWYLANRQAEPYGILAVTFTNKAAREMRQRLETLIRSPTAGMWVGTFHAIAHRILRRHWQEAGLRQDFQILDGEDQYRVVRRTIRRLQLDEKQWEPARLRGFINNSKEQSLRPWNVEADGEDRETTLRVYREYHEYCEQNGLVDFAELLLRVHELFLKRGEVLAHYRGRFRHVLVDEFQDTNALQYAWLRLFVGEKGCLYAVGDDDQSIYSWRGARSDNMLRFREDFAGGRLLLLERNYRSSSNILSLANALIAHNGKRLGKNLWTWEQEGDKIGLYTAFNEKNEAAFLVEQLTQRRDDGADLGEAAILYRTSAQSRPIEEALLQSGMPYRIYGGLRFYERREIKDALAYLRLALAPDDDPAFERIVNVPTRGIGPRTLDGLRRIAGRERCSLWRAAKRMTADGELPSRSRNALTGLLDLLARMRKEIPGLPLAEAIRAVNEGSGLPEYYRRQPGERGLARVENLEELVAAAAAFEETGDVPEDMSPAAAFLAHTALDAGERAEGDERGVNLMTLHSAKGLEFEQVFIVGLEEGLLPHQLCLTDTAQLEEERRLCYVGITRARRRLTLTWAMRRWLHGLQRPCMRSRFLDEMPGLQDLAPWGGLADREDAPVSEEMNVPLPGGDAAIDAISGLTIGQRVIHPTFGEGVVLGLDLHRDQLRVRVRFAAKGSKWLIAELARLQPA